MRWSVCGKDDTFDGLFEVGGFGVLRLIDGEIVPVYGCLDKERMKMRRSMGRRRVTCFLVNNTP